MRLITFLTKPPTIRVKSADLTSEKLLLLEEGHSLRDQALEVCERAGAEEFASARGRDRRGLRCHCKNRAIVGKRGVRQWFGRRPGC